MKIVIFAGGSGTRFWPLSRQKSPKQFRPLVNDKSTFELHINHHVAKFGRNDVLVATTELLSGTIKNLYPNIPLHNMITEPERRDLGPAVALVMLKLAKMGVGNEPVAIVWADSIIGNIENYFAALEMAVGLLKTDKNQLIYLGQKPGFANENLGWIETGKVLSEAKDLKVLERTAFEYRPALEKAQKWFKAGTHLWNTGFFVTTPNFIIGQYERQQPEMHKNLQIIKESLDTNKESEVMQEIYPQLEAISFDNAILEGLDNSLTKVISGDFDWADPGTLYAFKQYLQPLQTENAIFGSTFNYKSTDSLVYNLVDKQLITTIGLDGFIVINTPDALLICHKDQIPEIKNMLKTFEHTDLQKYL